MVLSTFLPLVAGRFGLAPTSTRHTNAGAKLLPADKAAGLVSNDPAGFNAVDVLALGALVCGRGGAGGRAGAGGGCRHTQHCRCDSPQHHNTGSRCLPQGHVIGVGIVLGLRGTGELGCTASLQAAAGMWAAGRQCSAQPCRRADPAPPALAAPPAGNL